MGYSQIDKEQLGTNLLEYIFILEKQLSFKLKNQLTDKIITKTGEYKIKNIESVATVNIDLNRIKIHSLFSPNGCKISGSILINVIAEVPNTNRDLSKRHLFTINFESTLVKYIFENETFEVLDKIGITYITD